ncbi:F-box domain-containing protein [Verticillium dahliae]
MPSYWNSLPLEIRWMIRDRIRDFNQQSPNARPHYQRPSLVCREWHSWFTYDSFRLLVLDQDRIHDFDRLVSDNETRRGYVECIVLRVKLPEYGCLSCDEEEEENTARNNDQNSYEHLTAIHGHPIDLATTPE